MRRICALLALVLASCGAPGPDPIAVGVYSEFLAPADVTPALPVLAAHHAALSIATPASRIGDPDFAALLRAAEAAHVEVRLWLTLDRTDGYWPNETNLAIYGDAVDRLLAWLASEDLAAAAVVFDVEPAYAYSEELRTTLMGGNFDAVLALMRAHQDLAAFTAARSEMDALVLRVHAAGLRAECVTYPQVVDDLGDGDADVQDAMDLPVDGVGWDEIAVMVYETGFAEQASGEWLGAGLVQSYASDAHDAWGERATIALGLVGSAGIFAPAGPVYTDPEVLRADVAAVRMAGATRVELYSLDGMLGLAGGAGNEVAVGRWLDATVTFPVEGRLTPHARSARTIAHGLDATLDAP